MSPKEEMGAMALQELRHAQQDSLQQRQHPARTPRTRPSSIHTVLEVSQPQSMREQELGKTSQNWGKNSQSWGKTGLLSARGSAREPGSTAELGGAFPSALTKGARAGVMHMS